MLTHKTYSGRWALSLSLFSFLWGLSSLDLKAEECQQAIAQAISIQGQVEFFAVNEKAWKRVHQGDHFCSGDHLRVGPNSRAGLTLHNESLLRLAENSNVRFRAPARNGSYWLDLLQGVAHFISRLRHSFQVDTPCINASVDGTEFTVEVTPDRTGISVFEGEVRATNIQGEVVLNGGQRAVALSGQAPRVEAVVDPLNAVQWALYYPPLIDPTLDHLSAPVRQSVDAYRRGDIGGAFTSLAEVSNKVEQDALLLVYRASLHLQVGGIDAARRDLDAALQIEPKQAGALALMSIIFTVRNEHRQGLEMAKQAVESSDDKTSIHREGRNTQAAAAYIALSYAHQAHFQLPKALEAARNAVHATPESYLAWSRLAQLELMFRNLDASMEAADRAVEIAPEQPQSLTTLGFARLIRLDLDGAHSAFAKAITLDQAAPLPRLGLGLVQIRKGDLIGGRRQIEIAANLDPGNALIRSYLGKAYYEEKRNKHAATQFALAKRFDTLDPTAWFYDAILKQSENRPVEALNDLQTSIDLNDNRAVYRSRLLLDQDEAARNASQARVYQDLGFERLAQIEAYKSLQTSPQTHSAHRLLSDSYAAQPRYESARLSELLQSQLLQPLNTNSIQPQLATGKLGILDGAGPSDTSFSEYTPLFISNGLDVQLNAVGGDNGTVGDDLILSGLQNMISFSLGQFHYETNGWRENNDLSQDIYAAFLQASLSPSTSIQFEYRTQDAESGDLAFRFEPDVFSAIERNSLERKVGRIGLHHQFSPRSHIIASAIYQDILQTRKEINRQATHETSDIVTDDSIVNALELQLIQRIHDHSFTLGGGDYDENYSEKWFRQIILPPSTVAFRQTTIDEIDSRFKDIYFYSLLRLPTRISMTLGLAYEDYKNYLFENDQVSPKFGLSWEASDDLTFRVAYLKSLTRPYYMEQTIEPTQVAGFNQLFDDVSGSEIKQIGLAVDAKLGKQLSAGVEFNRRDLQVPFIAAGRDNYIYEDRDEERSHAYFYWMASDRLGVRVAYEKEKFERPHSPEALTTERIPIGFSYHWPWGLFLQAEGVHIDQEITRSDITEQDDFWNIDAVLGYRFPKRYGKFELIVKNMSDKQFSYYDLSFHSGEQQMPKFQPERQLFARITLNY